MSRCNCDASCGENRYHNFGDVECYYRGAPKDNWPGWAVREYNKTKDESMAKYDQGGGCPCGLYKECVCESASVDFRDVAQVQMWPHKGTVQEAWDDMIRTQTQEIMDSLKDLSATRPWGNWSVLDEGKGYKVKRLEILPDKSISLQYHVHRAEIWNIVQGEGKVIIDGDIFTVRKGDSFVVPKQALHKVTNTHLNEILIAVEVQMGDICEESDIVRC